MVINQIGVGVALLNTLFMATVGTLALGLGLAFGLGGRETAKHIVERWYSRSRESAPRVAADATDALRQTRERVSEPF